MCFGEVSQHMGLDFQPIHSRCVRRNENLKVCVCFFFFFASVLQIYKYYALFTSLPQIACLAFLSFQYPLLLFKGLKGKDKNSTHEVSVRPFVCLCLCVC